ncbi:MAG: glycosyl transferase [Anaerolineae bacterium]|nr:glycosyl transferase [Anaerolineae bacterium]
MRFGTFDDRQREYVITRPDTPLPWINYLGCESYFGIISNTGGGYSFYQDARLRRLTRYRYNNVPTDYGGRYLYLRDNVSGDYWTPTWQPIRNGVEDYTCRHGMGYTVIQSTSNAVTTKIRYFVPLGETLEIWQATITNNRDEAANLSIFSAVEFALWDAQDDAANFQRNLNIGEVEIVNGVIYHKTEYRERRDHFAYFACSEPIEAFDTQREDFLGPYRGWHEPIAVEEGRSRNSVAHGWSPIGSHHVKLALQPGESKQVIFVLGYQENPRDAKFDPPGSSTVNKKAALPIIAKYTQQAEVDKAFDALYDYWEQLLSAFQIDTPDEHTNRMVNIWNAYQNMITFNMSRSASQFESGIGRGMGFRDSAQDLVGFVHIVPERARERIIDLASTQFENGGAYHQYQPLTKRGNAGVGGGFNDDPLWLIVGVAAYLKETGDRSILDEMVQFDNTPGTEAPLLVHLERSLQYTLDNLGPHQLPLIGRADWNDCLNLNTFSEEPGESFQTASHREGGVAESIFIGGLFVIAACEMAAITGDESYNEKADRMVETVLEHGWDGDWFKRAYDHFGQAVGSKECEEGQIFIEPQGICIMAGIGFDNGYAQKALKSVDERLATQHGIVVNQPAYTRYYLQLGEISSYPPGYKENASIFCHTNPWIMISATMLDDGDLAFDYYTRINPSAREAISEVHRCEPFVYAQTIAGRDAPTHGEAKNSWLTGTAAWNYAAITQWILGIRPTYDGLEIQPVLPSDWDGFTAVRQFRGVTFNITVRREGPGNTAAITVDGEAIDGTVVPVPDDRSEVEVIATLG